MRKINQQGQIVIILLLIMVVALAIVLSVVTRSVTEISTATKTEDSSRAFSAAEAGLERALKKTSGSSTLNLNLDNESAANTSWDLTSPKPGQALEYPPMGKESFAQFWLASPVNFTPVYTEDNFEVYFGDVTQDYTAGTGKPDNQPAIEVSVILKKVGAGTCDGVSYPDGTYYSKKYYYDSYPVVGAEGRSGGFESCVNKGSGISLSTNLSPSGGSSQFYCKVRVPSSGSYKCATNDQPIMVRTRLLYTGTFHPVALKPTAVNLPTQAGLFISKGTAGNVQRTIRVFKVTDVMPALFDYVLFSTNSLAK